MRYSLLLCAVFLLIGSQVLAQGVSITGPDRSTILEGQEYNITWEGKGIQSTNIIATGVRTPVGGRSRGRFSIVVATSVKGENGSVGWKAPWIDAAVFVIEAKSYDSNGKLVAQGKRAHEFRPAVMANRTADGLYLALDKRTGQRLYKQVNQRITRVYLSSSSENYDWRPIHSHPRTPHDHAGVFRIIQKEPNHYSKEFQVNMPWAMRYLNGHFIHATSRAHYHSLGRPASGGCNRLTRHDARELYMMTPIGTRVEIIGPKG